MNVTVAEIALILGASKQAVYKRLEKFGLQPISERLLAGSSQYDHELLPYPHSTIKKIGSTLLKRRMAESASTLQLSTPDTPQENSIALAIPADLPGPATLKQWQRECMEARVYFMRLIEAANEKGVGINRACALLEEQAHTGQLPEEAARLAPVANQKSGRDNRKRALSASTLLKWWSAWVKSGKTSTSLAPRDSEKYELPPWAPYFLECYRRPQKPSIPSAITEMALTLPPGMPIPSRDQCDRFLKKFSRIDLMKGRMTGAELARHKPFTRRDTSGFHPLDICLCDGHSFKSKVAHPRHGRPFKPEICAVLDAATSAVIGWSAGLSESNMTVADALRHANTVDEGKPLGGMVAILYTDKGAGNEAEVNSDPYLGRYARMGITFKTGRPGNPRGRGKVERLNQSLWIPLAKTLPTFTGKGMDSTSARKVYLHLEKDVREAKKEGRQPESKYLLSWYEFLTLVQQGVDAYNHKPHSSLPKFRDETGRMRHMSPIEAWDKALASGWSPDVLPASDLEDLFRPWQEVVTRNGEVRLFGNIYFNRDLQHYHGMKVIVEYAVQDGSRVWVRDLEHRRLIVVAGFEANKKAFFPVSAVDDALDKRATRREELKLEQISEIRSERDGVFGLVNVTQDSKLIEARRELEIKMSAAAIPVPEQPSNVIMLPQTPETGFSIPENPKERFQLWQALERILSHGGELSEPELSFYEGFQESSTFRGFKRMDEMNNAVVGHGVNRANAHNS